jgi:hypothetical protein
LSRRRDIAGSYLATESSSGRDNEPIFRGPFKGRVDFRSFLPLRARAASATGLRLDRVPYPPLVSYRTQGGRKTGDVLFSLISIRAGHVWLLPIGSMLPTWRAPRLETAGANRWWVRGARHRWIDIGCRRACAHGRWATPPRRLGSWRLNFPKKDRVLVLRVGLLRALTCAGASGGGRMLGNPWVRESFVFFPPLTLPRLLPYSC